MFIGRRSGYGLMKYIYTHAMKMIIVHKKCVHSRVTNKEIEGMDEGRDKYLGCTNPIWTMKKTYTIFVITKILYKKILIQPDYRYSKCKCCYWVTRCAGSQLGCRYKQVERAIFHLGHVHSKVQFNMPPYTWINFTKMCTCD